MKLLKIIIILIIILSIVGIGITIANANFKHNSIADENVKQKQEETQIDEEVELSEEIETEEITLDEIQMEETPIIQGIAETSNKIATENKKDNTEQKANTNSQVPKQQEKSTTEQQATPTQQEKPKEEKPVEIPKPATCTGNSHATDVGTSIDGPLGWYNTKAEAVAIYTAKVREGSEKWGNYKISTAEYERDYPNNYEVWTCTGCNKWTVNFLYK